MKSLLPKRPLWRAAIYIICTSLVLVAADLLLMEVRTIIHPGYDTTRITSPVLPDGAIDYFQALDNIYGHGVTPENNAAVSLIRAIGRTALPSNQPPDGITDRLGMAHIPETGDYYVTEDDYFKANSADLPDPPQPDLFADAPLHWPLVIPPGVQHWVDANQKPLLQFVEASKRPRFFIPFFGGFRPDTLFMILLPHLNPIHNMSDAILARAVLRLQAGDAPDFIEDSLAAHRMARLIAGAPTLIEALVGYGTERNACRIDRLAAASGQLSALQCRQLASALETLPKLSDPADHLDTGERFMALDFIQALAHRGVIDRGTLFNAALSPNNGANSPAMVFGFAPVPFEQSMVVDNRLIDATVAAMHAPTYSQRLDELNAFYDNFALLKSNNPWAVMTPFWAADIFLPNVTRAMQTADKSEMENRLTRVSFALAAYKSDHGSYPQALSDLVPSEIAVVPDDIFSDQPLVYAPTSGGYTLYSVGPDMKDDGGKADPNSDDIIASLP
jgi:hypothetical protein